MKEPVLFKTHQTTPPLPTIDRQELIVARGETRFAFLRVKETSGVSEWAIEAKAGAQVEVVMLQDLSQELESISRVKLTVGQDASIRFTFIQSGAKRAHLELETEVAGTGAQVQIRGLQWAKQNQKLSFEAKSRHSVPHTQSDLQVWCIAQDEAHSIFNGVITIDEGAHHTEAYQKNKNLLLSDRATVDSFPKLFIGNDDVKCAHGSTISQLEPDQFYYLQSRGIGAQAAEQMLLKGFIHQSFAWISDSATKIELERIFEIDEEKF